MALVPGRLTTAAIRTDGGELEVSLSDGGHWQVKAKVIEEGDWRSLCRGHLDGSIGRGSLRTLDSHASRVRCRLREAGAAGFIVNSHGRGYKLRGRGGRCGMNALDLECRPSDRAGARDESSGFSHPPRAACSGNCASRESLPGRAGGADGLEEGLPRPHRLCPGLTDPSEGMPNLKEILP